MEKSEILSPRTSTTYERIIARDKISGLIPDQNRPAGSPWNFRWNSRLQRGLHLYWRGATRAPCPSLGAGRPQGCYAVRVSGTVEVRSLWHISYYDLSSESYNLKSGGITGLRSLTSGPLRCQRPQQRHLKTCCPVRAASSRVSYLRLRIQPLITANT